jgi:quercetin dioxygenase-like cupin family protein
MTERIQLPTFVREAFDDVSPGDVLAPDLEGNGAPPLDAAELDAKVAALLEPIAPPPDLLRRLTLTVSEPPHRYAPFYGHVAKLFDLDEDAIVAQLARLKDPKSWRFAGLPGIHHVEVKGGARVANAETLLVRFAPGTYFPRHQHVEEEHVFVLEGDYTDDAGVHHRAGELREWPPGTAHSFQVSKAGPCIFASVVFGRRFEALPLRVLSRLLGR